jgi:hypothetical protein
MEWGSSLGEIIRAWRDNAAARNVKRMRHQDREFELAEGLRLAASLHETQQF